MKTTIISIILSTLCLLFSCNKDQDLLHKDIQNQKNGSGTNTAAATTCGCSTMPPVTITKNLVTDFGAVPNDGLDDSRAFICASKWLNANWSNTNVIRLYIPSGIYKAGVQLAPGASFATPCTTITNNGCQVRLGIDMINLNGCKNIEIYGDLDSKIEYNNGLYFGGYDPGLNPIAYPVNLPCTPTTNNPCYRADIGAFINLTSSSCISIKSLKVFGNNTNILASGHLGGHISECNGYQLGHDGIIINASNYVSVTNVTVSNFSRDGILIMNSINATNPQCPTLTDVLSLNNSRQGLSLTAADNLLAKNCQFNGTGSVFGNNPSCGVDIEPEFLGTVNVANFISCKFLNNAFCGVISDNHPTTVNNITFNSCEFLASGTYSHSIWPYKMSNTTFTSCTIKGRIVHASGISPSNTLKFKSCTITDWNGGSNVSGWGDYLFNFGSGCDNFEVLSSNINLYRSGLIILDQVTGNNRIFSNNNFNFNWNNLQTYWTYTECNSPPYAHKLFGSFSNCVLNSNSFTDLTPSTSPIPATNARFAFLAAIPSPNISDGLNTFTVTPGFFSHFSRRTSSFTCGLSSSNF